MHTNCAKTKQRFLVKKNILPCKENITDPLCILNSIKTHPKHFKNIAPRKIKTISQHYKILHR